jgi:sugar-specific transcriptional regulator TrmB
MNQQRVQNALGKLGLPRAEVKVYVYLALNGPQEAERIAEALDFSHELLHTTLESLKNKEIITMPCKQITTFSAITFNDALEILLKAHLKEAQEIEQNRIELLQRWQAMIRKEF